MGAGQPGPLLAKSAGPTAKLRASGPRARSKSRPADLKAEAADLRPGKAILRLDLEPQKSDKG